MVESDGERRVRDLDGNFANFVDFIVCVDQAKATITSDGHCRLKVNPVLRNPVDYIPKHTIRKVAPTKRRHRVWRLSFDRLDERVLPTTVVPANGYDTYYTINNSDTYLLEGTESDSLQTSNPATQYFFLSIAVPTTNRTATITLDPSVSKNIHVEVFAGGDTSVPNTMGGGVTISGNIYNMYNPNNDSPAFVNAPANITNLDYALFTVAIYNEYQNPPTNESVPYTVDVNAALGNPSSVKASSSQNPSTYGQSISLSATVSSVNSGLPTPTGSASFYDGSTFLGNGMLNASGTATISTASLPIGNDPITAAYIGDSNFSGSTSMPLTQVVNGQQFPIDFAATDIPLVGLPPKFYTPVDIQLDEFVANFTEQATSPRDVGAIGTATGNTNTNNGVVTSGRYIEVTIPSLASVSVPSEIIAYATVQVTLTLFQTVPSSVALGSPPPPDSQVGTIITGAKNVWLNQHNASDEVLEWYTPSFTTYWENSPLGAGPIQIPGSGTGPLEDWVDISPAQAALPFTTILQQAEQTIESANSTIVFKRNLGIFLPLLMIADPGQTSLLVTDPNGNETGTTANGSIVQNILGSACFPSLPLVLIPTPSSGLYQTAVQGLTSGTYQLITGLMNENEVNDQQSFTGTLAQGQSITYFTTVDGTAGSANTTSSPPINTTSSGLVYNRGTQLFGGTITLTNNGSTALTGTLQVEVTGLPAGATLANASGIAADGNPYILINLANYSFAGGQSINFTVLFADPTKTSFQYEIMITNENS